MALGIARATLDAFIQIATTKVPMLATKPLRDNAVVQSKVAVAEAEWQSSRALSDANAARDVGCCVAWRERSRYSSAPRFGWRPSMPSIKSKEVVETAYHFAGGTAIFENQAFERRLRDIHAVTQQVQSQFVNFEVAGQVLLGLPVTSKLI